MGVESCDNPVDADGAGLQNFGVFYALEEVASPKNLLSCTNVSERLQRIVKPTSP